MAAQLGKIGGELLDYGPILGCPAQLSGDCGCDYERRRIAASGTAYHYWPGGRQRRSGAVQVPLIVRRDAYHPVHSELVAGLVGGATGAPQPDLSGRNPTIKIPWGAVACAIRSPATTQAVAFPGHWSISLCTGRMIRQQLAPVPLCRYSSANLWRRLAGPVGGRPRN